MTEQVKERGGRGWQMGVKQMVLCLCLFVCFSWRKAQELCLVFIPGNYMISNTS